MESTMARDSRRIPISRISWPPCWNPFSITIPAPSRVAPDFLTISIRPRSAHPLARKSSIRSTWSSGPRNFLERITSYTFLWVKDSTLVVYISPSRFTLCAFLAKTTGTSKYCAAIQAIPIPDASIVRILVIGQSEKRRLNSLPISLMRVISIWWFKKLSTFKIFPGFTTPSLRIRSFKSFIDFSPLYM